jgi:hypothetical protein
MGINEEWSAPSAAYGHPMAPPPKPVPPAFSIGGRVVDPHTGQWADQTPPPPPPRPPTSSAGAETVVARAYATAVKVRDQHAKYVAALKASAGKYSPDGYRGKLAEFANTAEVAALDAAEQKFAQRKAVEEARISELLGGVNRPGDVAGELRRGRIWDADKAQLDKAADTGAVARTAAKLIEDAADADALAVLSEQLPSYLDVRNVPGGWLNDAFAEKLPELGAARTNLNSLNQAAATLNQTFGAVRRGIAAGRPAHPRVLPDPAQFDPDR